MSSKQPLVSVIIPIFNAEKYLKKCLMSVIEQTYSNIEIILVNDGSVDNSCIICEEFAKRDNRIKVIVQPNEGVSSARNRGLENVHGEYVMFVDADDMLLPDSVKHLIDIAVRSNADIVSGKILRAEKTDRINEQLPVEYHLIQVKNEILERMFVARYDATSGKMYKAQIACALRFVIGKRINEDVFYVFEYILRSSVLAETDCPVYVYYVHKESASHADFSEKFYDILFFMEEKIRILQEYVPEREDLIPATKFKHYLALLNKMASCRGGYTKKEFNEIRRNVLQYKYAQKSNSRKEKIRLCLIQYFVPVYLMIMRRNR